MTQIALKGGAFEQSRRIKRKELISDLLESGQYPIHITPHLPGPSEAWTQEYEKQISFVALIESGDPFAVSYIEHAICSTLNNPDIIARMLSELIARQLFIEDSVIWERYEQVVEAYDQLQNSNLELYLALTKRLALFETES